jgi:replicative DNA helicase
MILEYEVNSQIPDKDRSFFIGEWNLVENFVTAETPEILIAKLREAQLGREVLNINESLIGLLSRGDIKGAVTTAKRSFLRLGIEHDPEPTIELTDYDRRKKLILDKKEHPELYAPLLTGFKKFDTYTGGLYKGELTLVAGLTGVGKSTFCKQLELNVIRLNPGKNVLHIANEEYMEQVEHKFDASVSMIPYKDFKRATISQQDMDKWEADMQYWKKYGKLYMKSIPAFSNVTLIEQAIEELASKGVKIDLIVIDHLPHVMPIMNAWNDNDERAKAAADCKELARSLKLPVVTPTQAATIVEEKQAKGQSTGKMDVYGSKAQVHVSNTFMLVTEIGKDPEQTCDEFDKDVFWKIDIKKNRDGPPFFFTVKHYVHIGRIEEVHDLDNAGKKVGITNTTAASTVEEQLRQAVAQANGKEQAMKEPDNSPKTAPNPPVKPSEPVYVENVLPTIDDALQPKGDAYEGDIPIDQPVDMEFGDKEVDISAPQTEILPEKQPELIENTPPDESPKPLSHQENLTLLEKMRLRIAPKSV